MEHQVFYQKEPLFYLFKHKDIDGLQLPLKGSSRVKYTSFNVSTNYIALGTNAGGIHIFRRSSLRHYRFLNAKVFPQPDSSRILDVGVTTVLFCGQEKLLAASLSSGHVAVWALNFDKRESSQIVKKTDEHKGLTVTGLCWNSSSTKLFIGDSKGCVSGLEVSSGKIRYLNTIIKEGPPVVQLDFYDEKLLISNTKRCVYYHPSMEHLVQIGTKARDGLYGACFLPRQGNDQAVIYCARPGARLWQVDSSGQVLSTQQYKKLLATASSPITGHVTGNEKSLADKCETYNFPKLFLLRDQYLMTWTRENIIIFDPLLGTLILWTNQLENIEDICCNLQEMYVFHTDGHLSRYSLIPPKECAAKLFVMGDWLQCSKVLISSKSQIIPATSRDYVPEYVVRRLKEMLNDNLQHEAIVNELAELETNLERLPNDVTSDDNVTLGASSLDESESCSITSDVLTNPDSESMMNAPVDFGMEDGEDTSKSDKKEKLTRLKNVFKEQLKEFSLDTVLLAGAQAAGHMSFSGSFAFGGGGNIKPFSSYDTRSSRWNTRSPADNKEPSYETTSVESLEDLESDTEEKKTAIIFKEKKKKKRKVHTVDLVSPLQPTDLIKLEKPKVVYEELDETHFDSSWTADGKTAETINWDAEITLDSSGDSHAQSQESKEGIRFRSVAAKQEVVQKARKFLKKLNPEEKDMGTDGPTKAFGGKGAASKGMSTNITSPLEVKSLVIISRETRKKIRENPKFLDPRALKSTLREWIIYLEKANIAVDLVYPKNKDTREYYVTDVGKVLSPSIKADLSRFLDPDDTTIVSELTKMCFKMKIYSSSSESDCEGDENELTMEQLLKCDTCKQKRNGVALNVHSLQVDGELHLEEGLKDDLAKTKFLCVNFQLLSYQMLKGPVIAECLTHRDLLKNLLRCLDDFTERDAVDDAIDTGDTKVALQLMKDKAENYQKRLLRHVFRLYYLVPRDVAKLCAEIYPQLDPWEVVLVSLSTSTNLYSNCSDFLIYVTHLIQNHAKKFTNSFDIFNEVVCSEDFLILVYHSALILDDLADCDVRCRCGWPRPGSHQTSFQYEELMIDIIKHFKENHDTEALKKLLKISWNHGYWQGCIQLLVMLKLRVAALKLCLQLGDISLLDSLQIWGWLPQYLSEWKFGLQYLARFEINTENCENVINVETSPANNETKTISKDYVESVYHEGHICQVKGIDEVDQNTVEDGLKYNEENNFETSRNENSESKESGNANCETSKENNAKQAALDNSISQTKTKVLDYFQTSEKCPELFTHKKENSDEPNGRHSESHTCVKFAVSTGNRSLHINLKSYLLVMLDKVGAKRALKIISAANLQNFFSPEFYYKCILSSLVENHQSPLSHRILHEVNDHMCRSSKSTALVPEIYQMKEIEISTSNKVGSCFCL